MISRYLIDKSRLDDDHCLGGKVTPTMDESVYIRDVASVATCVADSLRQDCMQQGCISSGYSYASIYR